MQSLQLMRLETGGSFYGCGGLKCFMYLLESPSKISLPWRAPSMSSRVFALLRRTFSLQVKKCRYFLYWYVNLATKQFEKLRTSCVEKWVELLNAVNARILTLMLSIDLMAFISINFSCNMTFHTARSDIAVVFQPPPTLSSSNHLYYRM